MKYTEIEIDGAPYIRRDNEDGSSTFIVVDESNSDYQAYLEYIAENPVEDVE
jgi:hypothetical protein